MKIGKLGDKVCTNGAFLNLRIVNIVLGSSVCSSVSRNLYMQYTLQFTSIKSHPTKFLPALATSFDPVLVARAPSKTKTQTVEPELVSVWIDLKWRNMKNWLRIVVGSEILKNPLLWSTSWRVLSLYIPTWQRRRMGIRKWGHTSNF